MSSLLELNKLYEGIANLSQTYTLFKNFDHLPYGGRPYNGAWWECDEETYWEFLEVLPPMAWSNNRFAVCEAQDMQIHSCFKKCSGVFGYDAFFHCWIDLCGGAGKAMDDMFKRIIDSEIERGSR